MNRSRLDSFLNWSVRVGRLFGVPINLHITLLFFLLPVLSRSGLDVLHGIEYAVLIVLSILCHELGHALTAKHYRLGGLSIMLHGFGGFATSSGTRSWKEDLYITLAGPAVTFAIAAIGLLVGAGHRNPALGDGATLQLYLLWYLGYVNLLMGILNLMPSLPFDGGQAVRAVLARKRSDFSAMRIVGHVGLVVTPFIVLYALVTNQSFIGLFGFMGFVTSLLTLLNSGGVRFKDLFAERRAQKEAEATRARKQAQTDAYLEEVRARERERQERERLRKILESSMDDD